MSRDPKDIFKESVSAEFRSRVLKSVESELAKNRERSREAEGGRRWFLWTALAGSVGGLAVVVNVWMRRGRQDGMDEGLEMAAVDPELLEMDEEFLAELELLEELEEVEGFEEEVDA